MVRLRIGGGAAGPLNGATCSEVSLLSWSALRTLLGLLPRGAGDAAPPVVVVEPGLLSPTKLLMRCSMSRRVSARPGDGDINCAGRQVNKRGPNALTAQGTNVAGAAYARAACGGLVGPKLSLPLKLCELCLLREDLISTLLHSDCPTVPSRD